MKNLFFVVFAVSIVVLTGCTFTQTSIPLSKSVSIATPKRLYDQKDKLSLHVDVKHLLELSSREQLEKYIKVVDPNGNKVTHLPVIDGQVSIFTIFSSQILDLKYSEPEVPISVVIYQVCSILQHDILNQEKEQSSQNKSSLENLVIEGISWNENKNSLSFIFNRS